MAKTIENFYLTFMQSQYAFKDYYVVIKATSYPAARDIAYAHFGDKFCTTYREKEFESKYWPKGILLTIEQLKD